MYQIDYKLFTKLVNENTELLKKAIKDGTPLTDILSKVNTSAAIKSNRILHSNLIMRKSFDILPATVLGLLPLTTPNGADAISVTPDGKIINYEIKTTEVNSRTQLWSDFASSKVFRGRENTGKVRKPLPTSVFRATYHIHSEELLASKNMHTILLCADIGGKDGYFDAWQVGGDYIVNKLGTCANGKDRKSAKREITLQDFMDNGVRANTVVPLIGYEAWLEQILEEIPQLKTGEAMPNYNEE